jgi:hypothetical protein
MSSSDGSPSSIAPNAASASLSSSGRSTGKRAHAPLPGLRFDPADPRKLASRSWPCSVAMLSGGTAPRGSAGRGGGSPSREPSSPASRCAR